MKQIEHYKAEDWKLAVEHWKDTKDPHPRRIVVIIPMPNKEQHRVLLVDPMASASFEIDPQRIGDVMREVSGHSALVIDLPAMGVAPLPPPVPPPGPIGEDTIYAAALNLFASAQVFGQLMGMRADQR